MLVLDRKIIYCCSGLMKSLHAAKLKAKPPPMLCVSHQHLSTQAGA